MMKQYRGSIQSIIMVQYVFAESSLKEYTFLETVPAHSAGRLYYECVITYDYEGEEIERLYGIIKLKVVL